MRTHWLGWTVGVTALALFGLGCKTPGTLRDQVPQNPGIQAEAKPFDPTIYEQREQPAPPPPGDLPEERESIAPEVIYLQGVFSNLSKAETFRAEMVIPGTTGTAKASIAYKQSVGLYGVLTTPTPNGEVKTDVFIEGERILFRSGSEGWKDLTGTADGKRLTNLFTTVLLTSGVNGVVLEYDTIFDRAEETQDGCKQYDVRPSRATNDMMSICVKADLPTFIAVKSEAGDLRIDYRDVNATVEVYRPVARQ